MTDPHDPTTDDQPLEVDIPELPPVPPGHVRIAGLGRTWTIPADVAAWPYEAGLAMEQGRNLEMLRMLLPRAEHDSLVALRPTVGDVQALVQELWRTLRATPGESPAS